MAPINSKLLNIIGENLPGANIIPISRKYYNETAGYDYLKQLSFHEDAEAIKVAVSEKFYAVTALAAVS
jgi:DNA mismatch repair protein MSH4